MKFKMPHAFTIIFILIILMATLTWFLPAGKFDTVYNEETEKNLVVAGTYKQTESNPQGFVAVLTAFSKGIIDASEVIAFVLIIGGAYGVILKTGAIESGLKQAIKRFGSKDKLIIPILMILFAVGGTTTGMWEETLPFFMITVPLMMALGYDPLVGVAIIVLGAGTGTLGSTVNPFSTGIASAIAGISVKNGLDLRALLFLLSVSASILYVLWYAIRIKKNPQKSIVYYLREDHLNHFLNENNEKNQIGVEIFSTRHKVILTLFFAMILFMIYAIISLGWWMGEITMLFLAVAIIAGLLSKMSNNDFWESFIEGSKDLLSAALVIGFARAIVIIANEGMILDTILQNAAILLGGLSKVSFVIINEFVQILIAFLVPSSSAHAALTMPIMAPLSDLFEVPRATIVTAYQSASGLVNLITPTSGVLMAGIAMARVSWGDWLKFVLPLLIIHLLIILFILILGILI